MASDDVLHLGSPPTHERLPADTSRNSNRLLIRDKVVIPASALDMVSLRREAAYIQQHVVIAKFVAELPSTTRHEIWILELEDKICARVALHRDVRGGFYFDKLESVDLDRQIFALTPCHLMAGTVMF